MQFLVGLLAASTGAASIAMYFVADRLRADPANFKVHRNASITLAACSLFFFVLLALWP